MTTLINSCLMAEYGQIGYIDEIVAVYRMHNKSLWSTSPEWKRNVSIFNLFDTLALHVNQDKDLVKKFSKYLKKASKGKYE